jgi:hypothetical protein
MGGIGGGKGINLLLYNSTKLILSVTAYSVSPNLRGFENEEPEFCCYG